MEAGVVPFDILDFGPKGKLVPGCFPSPSSGLTAPRIGSAITAGVLFELSAAEVVVDLEDLEDLEDRARKSAKGLLIVKCIVLARD